MSHQETVDRYRTARTGGSAGDLTLLEGLHPVKHALRFGAEILEAVTPDPDHPLELARRLAPDVRERLGELLSVIPEEIYEKIVPRPPSSGVVALARRRAASPCSVVEAPGSGPVVYLQDPMHLGNLGAAIRVAAAAGAAGLLASGPHDPWHPSALRGSAGLHYAIPVAAAGELPPSRRTLVAVDPGGEPLTGPELVPDGALLAFGSERAGLGPDVLERADRRIRIPMKEGVSSLNLATSVAVVLYAGRPLELP